MNSLLGVLLRFRRETTAVMCDIEQMFHFFHVDPEHRDFLRFLWYENNTPGRRIIEYRMNVQVEVMEAFPAEDRGKGVRDLDLRHDGLPAQGSLGVYWNLEEDTFTFKQLVLLGKKSNNEKPLAWDDPLPETLLTQWRRWRNSLPHLENVSVPRCYHPTGFGKIARREIHAFSDASKDAIGASIYLRLFNDDGEICTALLFGQSKVATAQTTSIPCLEY
ncbi:hypothetical protein P5673_029960 [Acropora cervicornis]|uniref:Uncharacterized protein n=1 Tax=Acropora cervicornis TaxID=6130 RepID=A0AAD9UTX9_ACRCE|nr:hypothetical protein P5673_029960 [Acropora cervicornis]